MAWFRREKVLFRTHESPFRRSEWQAGHVVVQGGTLYRITRWSESETIRLHRGGSVVEWLVWGRRVSDKELREEIERATDKLLGAE
jgi:hypothetical protein